MAIGDTQVIELTHGVFARLHEGLTNAGIIVGDGGVLVIDSLRVPFLRPRPPRRRSPAHRQAGSLRGQHPFPKGPQLGQPGVPGSTIVGHVNCRSEDGHPEITVRWREKVSAGDPWSGEAESVRITPPSLTFRDTLHLHFAGAPSTCIGLAARTPAATRSSTSPRTGSYSPATLPRMAASPTCSTATCGTGCHGHAPARNQRRALRLRPRSSASGQRWCGRDFIAPSLRAWRPPWRRDRTRPPPPRRHHGAARSLRRLAPLRRRRRKRRLRLPPDSPDRSEGTKSHRGIRMEFCSPTAAVIATSTTDFPITGVMDF